MNLAEKYRPTSLDQVVGQDKAVARVRQAVSRGRRCFWISGPTGSGKTTIARILGRDHCGGTEGIVELDQAGELTVDQLGAIDRAINTRFVWGGAERRCWIVNEAHYLKTGAIASLLGILERIERDPDGKVMVIFTTTNDGQEDLFGKSIDANPLLHRCVPVRLTNQGLSAVFAELVRSIAQREQLDGKPIEDYLKLAQKCKNSARAMLDAVDNGYMQD